MSAKMIQAARPINIQEQGSFEMIEENGKLKLVYISNDYKQNYLCSILQFWLKSLEPTIQIHSKYLKFISQRIK